MKVVTANRLIDGEVVFWRSGQWGERFAEADVFAAEDAARGDEAVQAGKDQPTLVVDPYLIDIADGPSGPAPVSYRERIRALGCPAPFGGANFAALASIQETQGVPNALAMVRELVMGHEAVARTARSLFTLVNDANDQPTADLLTQRLQIHEKTAWMLRSLLEG